MAHSGPNRLSHSTELLQITVLAVAVSQTHLHFTDIFLFPTLQGKVK